MYDVTVIGAGPGGMQLAIFAASEGLRTIVVEKNKIGGQIGQTPKLENLACQRKTGISGPELARKMKAQAKGFGVEFIKGEATDIAKLGNGIGVQINNDTVLVSKAAVLACGASWNKFDIPGVQELIGKCVHYGPYHCMKVKRGLSYTVIGGGNSSAQAIMELAQHANHVDVVMRSTNKCSAYLKDRISRSPNIKIHNDVDVELVTRNNDMCTMRLSNGSFIISQHIFFCGGLTPNTAWLKNKIKLDEHGYIVTDGLSNMTSLAGSFALGDCRKTHYRKSVANAIGDASNVITQIHRYLQSLETPSVS